ncbi:reverse transcriptase domain-containing protein [Tanacetum coccineum]
MPLFVWKKLSLLELTLTRMTLELADRSVAHPKGVAEDVFVKEGKVYFPANFVVVYYDVDPRVPLILRRPFLRTARALINVHSEELTLRVNDEAITPWVSPVHCVPKKGSMNVVENEDNELIPTRLVTKWRVCIDYRKLNDATHKDHFPLSFMDQIPIDLKDQEKTTFTYPYGTFAYRHMPFGLCNAPGTFQRCMMAIFQDMIEETMEVFMDNFSVFRDSFSSCLSHLDKMLKRCEDTNLVLN